MYYPSEDEGKEIEIKHDVVMFNSFINLLKIEYFKIKKSKLLKEIGRCSINDFILIFTVDELFSKEKNKLESWEDEDDIYDYWDGIKSKSFFNIRLSERNKYLLEDFLNSNNIKQTRPDGIKWQEENGKLTGDPDFEYFHIESIKDLFISLKLESILHMVYTSLGDRSFIGYTDDEVQTTKPGSRNFIGFTNNEIKDTKLGDQYVEVSFTERELEEYYRKEEEKAEDRAERDRYDYRRKRGIYNPNSWMEEPDDYWNID